MAIAQFRSRQYKDSAANFREALKLDDSNYQVWSGLGDALYYGGEKTEAMDVLPQGDLAWRKHS